MNFKLIWVIFLITLVGQASSFAQESSEIPAFKTFTRYDNGNSFTVDSLSKQGVNVLVFYDPGCGHCQELGFDISQNFESWSKNTWFYFISMLEKADVDNYINRFAKNLRDQPNVLFLRDSIGEFITLFDPKTFPSTYIYSAESGKLIESYDGANTTDKMRKHLVP